MREIVQKCQLPKLGHRRTQNKVPYIGYCLYIFLNSTLFKTSQRGMHASCCGLTIQLAKRSLHDTLCCPRPRAQI